MFKMRCGIPNAYILDITMYKMHVSLCSYCTIRILISKTLTGTYERGYTMYFRCVVIELWILLYILLLIIKYVHKRSNVKNIKKLCVNFEGPEDDCTGIETCCPNTIRNVIKLCCV